MKADEEIKQLGGKLKSLRAKSQEDHTLDLTPTEKDDLKVGTQKCGKKYSVRDNRDRFFYPNEWFKFYKGLKNDRQRLTFDVLMGTGARINEAIHIKVGDIDFERSNIILRVTKVKAKKHEKNPKPRTISISTQLARKLKKGCKGISNDEYIGLLSKPAAHICLKTILKQVGIKDWYMFSCHNIRKTHGNFLKALGIEGMEICQRLGHDMNTFLKSYGSPDIFNYKDMQDMKKILGDLYEKK